jgi:hypothetical protein
MASAYFPWHRRSRARRPLFPETRPCRSDQAALGPAAMSGPEFEPIERSLSLGRRRLGRFVQTDKRQFEAFGPDDNSLGHFKTSKQVLGAIRTTLMDEAVRQLEGNNGAPNEGEATGSSSSSNSFPGAAIHSG